MSANRRIIFVVATMFLAACGPAELSSEPNQVSSKAVMRSLSFAREEPQGVSAGLDLDGQVSGPRDGRSCFKEDFVDAEGTPGIDNELARLLPLVDLAGEGALEALIQGSINEGRLLVVLEHIKIDDGKEELALWRGMDLPLLGTDGRILPGQTLALDPEPNLGRARLLPTDDGRMITEAFELDLPVIVFSQLYQVHMPRAFVRFRAGAEGAMEDGLISGGIPVEQLVEILHTAQMFGGDFESLFGQALRDSADLARDASDVCTQTSASVRFEAALAFTFE